ncbi:hypothetical protein Pyn_30770 [Prunus yedoensis var. nudiflora]|uniref:Uncharacterized protein n=1 Tax=Prunus yedoensis var. nudiflora TaxID=2094558 RepID=A0A314UGV6_PRUYE|nr:hypothetical protein Pyn_30770 [Prunus yedoensis var. nudiflora]
MRHQELSNMIHQAGFKSNPVFRPRGRSKNACGVDQPVFDRMQESAMFLTPATAASAVSLYCIFKCPNIQVERLTG